MTSAPSPRDAQSRAFEFRGHTGHALWNDRLLKTRPAGGLPQAHAAAGAHIDSNGVSFGELAEVLKNVFVEVAARDFEIEDRKTSRSRIAIITGLTRKEVAKQEEILRSGRALFVESNLNRISRVLAGWHSDPDFTGPYGLPLELPFESGASTSFTGLVRKHSGDMAPRAMLDEMIRVGLVQQTASGAFKVLARAYILRDFHPDALERLGEVVHDFISTYEFNMYKGAGPGRFERKVFADDGLRGRSDASL